MINNTIKILCDQLEEANDCMSALVNTLAKYGHNTTDLLDQVYRNEHIIETFKDAHVILPEKQTHIFKRKLIDGTIDYYDEDLYNAEDVITSLNNAGVVYR